MARLPGRARLRSAGGRWPRPRPARGRSDPLPLRRRPDGLAAPGPAQPGVGTAGRAPARRADRGRRLRVRTRAVAGPAGNAGRTRRTDVVLRHRPTGLRRTRRRRTGGEGDRPQPATGPLRTRVGGRAPVPTEADRRLLSGLRVLELTVTGVRAKFKYAGNKQAEHREEIAAGLAARGGLADDRARAHLLRRLERSAGPAGQR